MLVATVGILLGLSMSLLAYTYLGYPLALLGLGAVYSPEEPEQYESEFPPVTMVVPAHNEASVIADKVDNTTEISYPGQFTCLFVSDSSDGTDEILREAMTDQMTLVRLPERRGKSYALNEAIERVESGVVVFSDANTMYESSAVERLVAPLADDAVGCVTGKLVLRRPGDTSAEGLYWRYERWLRSLETALGTTVSVNGGLMALRRADWEPLPKRALVDDLVVALRQARSGRRVHYEPAAEAQEYAANGIHAEFKRRVRIGAGNYQALAWFMGLLSPRRGILALQFLSHKVLRWLGPWLLLAAFLSTLGLAASAPRPAVTLLLGAQLAGYGLGAAGLASARLRSVPPFRLPAYFLAMNGALGLGCLQLLRGTDHEIWRVTARKE